ncbi:hypothetical protein P0D88_34915 [Paraburkholderia sp. RL18-103-BIB-C]|uniref:hypothetical protein n=1 Tax=Paraburkholderia sp. RL18-103-BIB-C TaxID=3031637 RepID=UPI0038BDEDA0
MKTPTITLISKHAYEWRYSARWPPSFRMYYVTYYPTRAAIEIHTSTGGEVRTPRVLEAVWRALATQ